MKLMVLDGNSIVNRAFYGVRLLSTRDGLFTNAVFGFLNILQKLVSEECPDELCITFDMKSPTFRHEKYDGYKAQRKAMPEELAMQIPVLKEVLEAMNIPYYQLEGYEADDIIGTISRICDEKGHECVIVTGDKDSFQLISDNTHVKHVKTRMGQTETKEYDRAAFVEEYGFEPIKIIDLKALMGDSSDNIPGVSGIGEKTALDLVRRFGTVEKLYDSLDTADIKESVKKKLTAGKEMAELSYELATIIRDVPIEFRPENNAVKPVDNDRLFRLFQRLEFTRMAEKYGLIPPAGEPTVKSPERENPDTAEIVTHDDAESFKTAVNDKECVFVSASNELDTVCAKAGNTVYIIKKDACAVYDELLRYVFSEKVKKGGFEVKGIMRKLISIDYDLSGWVFDAAIAAYLLEPGENSYPLDKLVRRYCGFEIELEGEETGGQMTLTDGTEGISELISAADAVGALYEVLTQKLRDAGMEKLLSDIEMPLCAVLAEMEDTGVFVDRKALSDFGEILAAGIKNLEDGIYEQAGETFNINSPKQLGTILFEKLMLPAPKKTKTGWSTNIDVLEKLKNKHPIINMIIEYRQLAKLKSTYADGLMKFICEDGRIHTTFQMTVTATGRLSSTDPNLQNIPVRTELGGEIRKMFIASPGNILVDADYSQIELRLLAHISGDETMRNAFIAGEDIHAVTASQVFGVPLDQVTGNMRSRAKAVNFGIVYGISQFSLSQDIGVSVSEAKEYMDRYLSKYHGVRDYMKEIVKKAGEDGYVSTIYGRRRYLPELKSSNYNIRAFGERVALNMPIQGTAADIMKIAMIKVAGRLKSEGLKARLILQIHDELIAECPAEEADRVKEILCSEMEAAAALSVPLTADAGEGRSWYEAK